MDIQGLKKRINGRIEARTSDLLQLAKTIYDHPETGYREFTTAKLVEDRFRETPLKVTALKDIPGVKATLDTGRPGPGVAIMGELDALICPEHPDSDPVTGAVHACGHNFQIATMIGALYGIIESRAVEALCGKIHFVAVPAEECIELGFRSQLRKDGVIRYFSGKSELLYRGFFDDVDLCLLIHSFTNTQTFGLPGTLNGCIAKRVRYLGKAAHAGGSPHRGINALYAANLGIMAINAIRETFRESDYVRVHPIITKGGDGVNVIPSEVIIETFVRAKTLQAIKSANEKVNRALLGGAIALGAQLDIEDFGGYLPLCVDDHLVELCREVMEELVDPAEIHESTGTPHSTGSTDLGDLSSLMPVLQPSLGGLAGSLHGADYRVINPQKTVVGAQFLAGMTVELLNNGAARAQKILENYKPLFPCKEAYFSVLDSLFSRQLLP